MLVKYDHGIVTKLQIESSPVCFSATYKPGGFWRDAEKARAYASIWTKCSMRSHGVFLFCRMLGQYDRGIVMKLQIEYAIMLSCNSGLRNTFRVSLFPVRSFYPVEPFL